MLPQFLSRLRLRLPRRSPAAPAGWNALAWSGKGLHGVSLAFPARGSQRPRVLRHAFHPGAAEDIASLKTMATALWGRRLGWMVLAQRHQYRMAVLPRPPVEAAELSESLRWALADRLGYPADQAVLSWAQVPGGSTSEPELYVAAAPRDAMTKLRERFQQADLELGAVDIQEMAQRNLAALAETPGELLTLVAPDEEGVQISFTQDGELLLDRYVAAGDGLLGGFASSGHAGLAERVAMELQRSLEVLTQARPEIAPGRVMLTPGQSALRAPLTDALGIPVQMLELAQYLDLDEAPELQDPDTQGAYLPALGAALRGCPLRS